MNAEFSRQALKAACDIDGVADDGELKAVFIPHVPKNYWTKVNSNSDFQSRFTPRFASPVQLSNIRQNVECASKSVVSLVAVAMRRSKRGHDAVSQVLIKRASMDEYLPCHQTKHLP